jgi:cobaltochelatase CobN
MLMRGQKLKSQGRTKITYVSMLPSTGILEGLKEIKREYGDVIDLAIYGVHDVEKESISIDAFKEDLASSHFVFIDGRGGDRLGQIMSEVLSKTDNAVLGMAGGFSYYSSPEDSMLVRVGSIRSKGMASGRTKGFLNSRVGRKVLKIITRLFAKDLDINKIIDEFDMTAIKDPQKLVNTMMRMERLIKFIPGLGIFKDLKNIIFILMYFGLGSREDMKSFLLLVASEYGELKLRAKMEPPVIRREDVIYHPDAPRFFDNLGDYKRWRGLEKDVTVGVIFYGWQLYEYSRPTVDLFIRTLEKDVNVISIVASSISYWKIMEKFFFEHGEPIIDLFLWAPASGSLTGPMVQFNPKESFRVLQKLNVPVLAPFGMILTPLDFWKKSNVIAPLDELMSVMTPELDGAIEPLPACAMVNQIDSDTNARWIKTVPIEDRCLKSCRRALRWIKLRQKENKDKKVAVVIYGMDESNLGGGGFLDGFGSLLNLLSEMKRAGYTVSVPEKKEDLLNAFLERGQVNTSDWTSKELTAKYAVKIPSEKYEKWLYSIPCAPREKMIDSWGDPPGEIMTYNQNLLLPGVQLGNIFIGLSPALGNPDNVEELLKSFHDKCTAPIHQYLAFYKWIDNEFDALIHFGTHGSLEWRAGKEVGLSQDCFPDVLIGDSPHIYVYWVGDSSEATLAKRRSYAVMVSHMSSPYMVSGLYDEYQELEDLIHEYHRAQTRDPQRAELVYQKITQMAEKAHFEGSVEVIYDKIYEMKRSIIPKGLHILGENLDDEGVEEYLTFALRYNRGEIKSLHRILAEEEGYSYLDLLKYPGKVDGGKTYAQVLEDIEGVVKQIVWELVRRRDVLGVAKEMFSGFEKNSKEDIEKALSFALDLKDRAGSCDELGGVLKALDGGYLLPRKGADIIRSPEVLPTGGNMYGFDPTKVPTEAAYERGTQIAEQVLKEYLAREGRYPQSVGIVLWGFETMNTEGETIGEILRLIGVEVVSTLTDKRSGWGYLSDLRVIPSSELGRPRVDVMITICGMFRDQFPHILEMLDKAFKMVSELPEEEEKNLVAQHTTELKQRSAELGIDSKLCHLRTFGPSESEYGTGALTFLIGASCWKDENDLADAYISGMKHIYGKDVSAQEVQKCFEYHASNVEVVSQIRDFTDCEITDLDHYFEFTGGLSTAVKKISGKRPHMFISDTTKEIIKTEDIKDAIERGVRTRTLNPKWLEAMLEHGYDGVVNIEDRVENILGLAATTEKVANWVWDEVTDRIVLNEEVRKQMEEANPWALEDIIDHLLEAERRGYWEASAERLEGLRNTSLEVEGWIEERGEEKPKSWKDTLREKYEED